MALESRASKLDRILGAELSWGPAAVAKNTGRTVVLDPVGLRHVDISQGIARLASVHLNVAVRWVELYRVVMELIHNPRMNMTQTRIVLVPRDANGFRAAHPDMAPMNGAARVGPDAWMLSLGMAYTPDQYVVSGNARRSRSVRR